MTDAARVLESDIADWLDRQAEFRHVDRAQLLRKLARKLRDGTWREMAPKKTD